MVSIRCCAIQAFILLACSMYLNATGRSLAQEPRLAQEPPANAGEFQRWAVIFVGLGGDDEHEAMLRETGDQIQSWLVQSLQFPAEQVLRLPIGTKNGDESVAPLTAESMRSTLAVVNLKLHPGNALWVFTLGHGNYDGRRAWFHVAGRDPTADDIGRWLADIHCREQVIWLMHSSSGWLIKPLSRPGRIVIAATAADDESNETEFPHALAAVVHWPVTKLDRNQDQAVSIAEFYAAVIEEVARRFHSDKRLPTEHAQLDDDGDGLGTEDIRLKPPEDLNLEATPSSKAKIDGGLARRTFVPYRDDKPNTAEKAPSGSQ